MMMSFDVLITQIDGLDPDALMRWIANEWVRPEGRAGHYLFQEIDVARVHLIYELREEMEVDEAALPVVLSLLDQVYDLRRRVKAIGEALGEVAAKDVRQAISDQVAEKTRS